MKATKTIGRLIVGCLFACCLTSKLHAQSTVTNGPNTGLTPAQIAARQAAEAAQTQALIQAMQQTMAQNQAVQKSRPQLTAAQLAAQQATIAKAQQAYYSNNLASVSKWLHDSVTNADGTPANSIQDYADLQANAFSTTAPATAIQQQSARDEALTWATANGIPTELTAPNGTKAVLVSREGNVPNYLSPCDLASDMTINTTNVWPGGSTGLNLTGTNTIIGQWDEGLPLLTHSEFGGRVSESDGYTTLSDHSTAVAGMMSAAGAAFFYDTNNNPLGPLAKGMAYASQVQAWSYYDSVGDLAGMTAAVGTNHLRLSNHSYEFTDGWYYDTTLNAWVWYGYWQLGSQDARFGNYTTNAANYDAVAVGAPTYLQVWAAGNEQNYAPPVQPTNHYEFTLSGTLYMTNAVRAADGDQGGYDTLSQQASAKDNLVVGAINPLPNGFISPTNVTIASFSSLGPTDDGRIKPDVVADGVNNIVPVSGGTYGIGSGTSFAAPSVTGSIDLLTQLYKQLHPSSSDLLSSTIKGLVIHTADSCTTNNGPSYKFGWGVMNTKTAGTLINQDATNGLKNQIKEVMLNNGQYVQFPVVSIGGTNNPLKATICWLDPVGPANSITNLDNPAIKLVNDLDLRIYSPSGMTNFPWILNPDLTNRTAVARSAAAMTGDDNRNNVEKVYIANPLTNATYTVTVTHKGTLTNSQWVSILISGNVAQQPPPLAFNQILQTATNTTAVGWPAVVGEQYQVQVNTDLTTTNWVNTGGIISARLTNVVAQVSMPTNTAAFYRFVQLP